MSAPRVAAILAALALAVTGCGGGGDEGADPTDTATDGGRCPVDALAELDEPVEVTVWHTEIGLPGLTLDKLATQYNDSQDDVVVNVQYQGSFEEQFKKFEDSLADPGSLPDIVMPDDTVTQFMADSGVVVPAQACIDADPDAAEIYEDMVPIVPAAYSIEDVLWPGAFSAAGAALYANVTHLETAGLDPTELPGTLDELRSTAETLAAAGIPGLEEPLVMRIDAWPLEFLTSGAGQAIVDQDNGRAGLATESEYANDVTLEVLDWLAAMERDGLLKYTDNADQLAPFLAMAGETSSMLIDTSAAISTVYGAIEGTLTADQIGLEDDVDLSGFSFPDLRLTVGELPGLDEPGKGQMGGAAWYLLDGEDPAAIAGAWDFMKFFNQTEQQVTWAMEASYFPVRRAAIDDPALQALWSDTEAGRWMAEAYRGFTTLDPEFPGPVIGPYKEFRLEVKNGLDAIILEGADTAETMERVDERFQEALDAYVDDLGP
jgi:sn-glycerol 3-phosphate transport system substrate-binding protein